MATVLRKSQTAANDCDSEVFLSGHDEKTLDASDRFRRVPSLGAPVELAPRQRIWHRRKSVLDAIATQPSVFDDPVTLELYRPPPTYENVHPTCQENSIAIQANTDNFLQDLRMTTDDYNLGNTLFCLCFVISELPAQIISKEIGPDICIPCQLVLWGLVGQAQYRLSGRGSFLAARCLLGFVQGGITPGVILYFSYFYTTSELPIRLTWYYISSALAQFGGAFLAAGILGLDGVRGKAGWRYLFFVDGGLVLVAGLASFFMMAPGPTQTKAWFRPKGWFTERDEAIMVNRLLRDDPMKSDTTARVSH